MTGDDDDSKGIKYDGDKIRYELIPADALHEIAKLYTLGAKKYGDDNWLKGLSWRRVYGAMMRHAWAWMRGEDNDPEDGQPHMASVAWCALTLLVYSLREVGEDDRVI